MDSKIIYQERYKINDRHADANKAGLAMSEILEKIFDMIGSKPTEAEVVDFANGGHLISKKLDEVTRSDARNFKSSSAKQAFEFALKTEQLKLSELQEQFIKVLHDRNMQITAYDLKGGLTLVVKQDWLSAVIESHTIRITPGSQRERIYNLVQTAHEALTALQDEIKAVKTNISPVQLQFKDSPDGLIFIPDNGNQPTIEPQYFSMFPDE